jgi:antitoxin component HigA of HigAB toxin-antitoxin module
MNHSEKIKRIETLMASPDVIELDALTAEVAAFEREAYPIQPPTLAEAMKFRRDQMRETQKEISMRAGISLNRWKLLEKGMLPSLNDARGLYSVGIPAQVILGENH